MTSRALAGEPAGPSSADISSPTVDLQPVTKPRNLFHQYMTRGLYQCSSRYVHALSKLQALIKEAFEEYTACEEELKKNPGQKSTDNAFLDQLLSELDDDEDGHPTLSKRSGVLRILGSRR
ncbi:hypothetical protein AAVH_15989 [Aphelenchoides avenae]|nr:hypothetical protein AAVH_15989 [Aphelenchus avenae]